MSERLEIKNVHVAVEGQEILKGVDLAIGRGEVHALMGPNGSAKVRLVTRSWDTHHTKLLKVPLN